MINQDQKDLAKEYVSEVLNRTKAYQQIGDVSIAVFDIYLDPDSQMWHEIEEFIVEKMIEQKTQDQ